MAADSTGAISAAAANVFGNEHSHGHGVCMLPSRAEPGHPAALLKRVWKKGESGAVTAACQEKRERCQHGQRQCLQPSYSPGASVVGR